MDTVKLGRFVLLFFVVNSCTRSIPLSSDLTWKLPSVALTDFKRAPSESAVITYHGKNNSVLRVNEIPMDSDSKAHEFIESRIALTKRLFADQVVAYTGVVTKELSCVQRANLNPHKQENERESSIFFDLFATDRFVYGTCQEAQEVYKSQFLVLYCKKTKKIFEIKYFFPKTEAAPSEPVFQCNP